MTHNTLHTRNHPRSTESVSRGERTLDPKFIRRRIGALATVVALGSGVIFAKSGSGSPEAGIPLWQQMDAVVERELHKGPTGNDTVIRVGEVGVGNTIQGIIAHELPAELDGNDAVLQTKASNASALEAQPTEGFLQPTDEIAVWEDAETGAILAAPSKQ